MIPIVELRKAVKLAETDSSADTTLKLFEASAIAYIENRTGHYFGLPKTATYVLRGNGKNRLALPFWPITDVDAVEIVEARDPAAAGTAITDFVIRDTYVYRANGAVFSFHAEYRVTMQHGYDDKDVPADIRSLVVSLVTESWNLKSKEGIQSEQYGGYSFSVGATLAGNERVIDILSPYMRYGT